MNIKDLSYQHKKIVIGSLVSMLLVGAVRYSVPYISGYSKYIYYLAVLSNLVSILLLITVSFWTSRFYPYVNSNQYKLLLSIFLLVVVYLDFAPTIKTFKIVVDSRSYSRTYLNGGIRPPAFYAFMRMVSGIEPSVLFNSSLELFPGTKEFNLKNIDYNREKYKPFIKIIKYQKIFLLSCWFICFLILISMFSPPLVTALFQGILWSNQANPIPLNIFIKNIIIFGFPSLFLILLLSKYKVAWKKAIIFSFFVLPLIVNMGYLVSHVGFVCEQINYFLSEPLAQAFLILIIGSVLLFFYRDWFVMLPITTLLCVLMYQTRPAAIFSFAIIGAMLFISFVKNRQKIKLHALISIAIIVLMLISSPIYFYLTRKTKSDYSPLVMIKTAFAMEVADKEDIKLLNNDLSKRFLESALKLKAEKYPVFYAEKGKSRWSFNKNLYRIALPVASELHLSKGEMNDVANTLLLHHYDRYFKLVTQNFRKTTVSETRLNGPFPFWWIMAVSLFLLIWLKGANMFVTGTLMLGHFSHLLIISMFNGVLSRYVHATEIMVVIAFFLLIVTSTNKLFGRSAGVNHKRW